MTQRRPGRFVAGLVAAAAVLAPCAPAPAGAQPYVPSGTSITGGDDAGSAVALAPGQYVDTLARGNDSFVDDGSARYFAIDVGRGETPYVAATIAPRGPVATAERLALSVELTAAGETSPCETDSESDDGSDDRLASVTAVAAPGPAGTEDGCPPGKILVRVARGGGFAVADPLEVELAYRLEPTATTDGLPAASPVLDTVRPQLTGPPATLASGDGFASAPVLGDGIYRDTLGPDDTRIVRVRLDWGQRLAYSVAFPAQAGVESTAALDVVATIRNPVRQAVVPSSGGTDRTSVGADERELSGSTPAPVRYANRGSDDADVAACSLAGDWFLVLSSDHPTVGTGDTTVPYTLQVQVSGRAAGAPDYRPEPGSSGPPSASTDRSDPISRTSAIVAITGGAVAVLGLVALVLLVRRRARQTRVHTHTPSG